MFRAPIEQDLHGREITFYRHQTDAFEIANRRESYVLTTGTGSGKRERLDVHQPVEDGKPYRDAKTMLDVFAKPAPIEARRFMKARELVKHRSHLRSELDRFAEAQCYQIVEWSNVETVSVLDAAEAVIDAVADTALKVVGAAGRRLIRMGDYLAEKSQPNHHCRQETNQATRGRRAEIGTSDVPVRLHTFSIRTSSSVVTDKL